MKLLLDSHVLIVLLDKRARALPRDMRQALSADDADLVASAASLWEVAIKARLGKLPLKVPVTYWPEMLEDLDYEILSVTYRHAVAELTDWPATRDPFDRLLLAQCQVENMKLVTLDRALAAHPLVWCAK